MTLVKPLLWSTGRIVSLDSRSHISRLEGSAHSFDEDHDLLLAHPKHFIGSMLGMSDFLNLELCWLNQVDIVSLH